MNLGSDRIATYLTIHSPTQNEKKVCLPSPYLNIAEITLTLADEEITCVNLSPYFRSKAKKPYNHTGILSFSITMHINSQY